MSNTAQEKKRGEPQHAGSDDDLISHAGRKALRKVSMWGFISSVSFAFGGATAIAVLNNMTHHLLQMAKTTEAPEESSNVQPRNQLAKKQVRVYAGMAVFGTLCIAISNFFKTKEEIGVNAVLARDLGVSKKSLRLQGGASSGEPPHDPQEASPGSTHWQDRYSREEQPNKELAHAR